MDRHLEATYEAERRHFWFSGFRQFVAPLLARAARGRRGLRVLDCGCGTGHNIETLLAPLGWTCGFDLTRRGLEFARHHGVRRLAQASVLEIPFRSASFDLVTSFDVLQCLDPAQQDRALAEFRRVLRPGGSLVVNVAALEVLRGAHSVAWQEVHRPRRATFRAALSNAGFHVDRLTYTNATLFPVMLAVRLAQRARGLPAAGEAETQFGIPPAPINAALSAALAAEARLLRVMDMPVGSSLLGLAHRD
jgi:ubiquinone/menaquinone biosynthesis C-methylase UbiE